MRTIAMVWLHVTLAALGAAEAATVLVFNSTRFVDSQQGEAYPPGSQESDNLQAALQALGHAVHPIAGPHDSVGACSFGYTQPGTVLATAAEYRARLATADVFVIPEQESWCYLSGELDERPDIVAAWREWVVGGGGLVVHSSDEARVKVGDLLETVFGLRGIGGVDGTGVTTRKTPAAQGTLFANGPAALPGNESTGALPLATLPPGATSIYDDGTIASVVVIPFGAGKIVFLGWDWTASDPPFTGNGLNGGWYPRALDSAVKEASAKRLTVAVAGGGTGTVAGSVAGIDAGIACGPSCQAHYATGAGVTLTAVPEPGSMFAGWSGGGCGGLGPCALTMGADTRVSALFSRAPDLSFLLAAAPGMVRPGQSLQVDLAVANPGAARLLDLYFGVVLPPQLGVSAGCPNGDGIAFFADDLARVALACGSAAPERFPPLVAAASLPAALPPLTLPGFWRLTATSSLPPGGYTVFLFATLPGALADGRFDPPDLIAAAETSFTVQP